MKAIEFYKFINSNNIEYHWAENPETNEKDVVFFLYFFQLAELNKMLSRSHFDDDGIDCVMLKGYMGFWASKILDYYGIELVEIFGEENDN